MAYVWWAWEKAWDGDIEGFKEMSVELTIHNDLGHLAEDFKKKNGIYLMMSQGRISDVDYYFGIQNRVDKKGDEWGREKRAIYSRWDTRDLANARIPEGGYTESARQQGDFIGVRGSYDWSAGDYRFLLAPDGQDPDGEWFGLWITDLDSGITTWIGSLKFPYVDGKTLIQPGSFTTIEVFGASPVRPIDIPEIAISVRRPVGDGISSDVGCRGYSGFHNEI